MTLEQVFVLADVCTDFDEFKTEVAKRIDNIPFTSDTDNEYIVVNKDVFQFYSSLNKHKYKKFE